MGDTRTVRGTACKLNFFLSTNEQYAAVYYCSLWNDISFQLFWLNMLMLSHAAQRFQCSLTNRDLWVLEAFCHLVSVIRTFVAHRLIRIPLELC